MSEKTDRTGETKLNNNGSEMTIIEYNNSNDITIKFDNGYITKAKYRNFKIGGIKSPYDKTVCDFGCLGKGQYIPKQNGKYTIQYKYWYWILERCFSKRKLEQHPTYEDKTVCDEWLCFQNFGEWFNDNYYEINNERIQLDKDILIKGNKIYSPTTCVFVPQRINNLFIRCDKSRGKYPIGVTYIKKTNNFVSRCDIIENNKKSTKNLGTYNTPEKAFESYKQFKEKYIKQVADEYKDRIPKKLYDAMYKYEVEITD